MIPADAPALVCANDRAYLRAGVAHWLAARDRDYPAAIEARKLAQDAAVEKLELARCLLAQWNWVCDPAEPPEPPYGDAGPFGAPYYRLAAEIGEAATIARQRASRDPANAEAALLAELYEALAWWQQPHGESGTPRIVFWTDLDRHLRREARAAKAAA
jgi:hypothetical protein